MKKIIFPLTFGLISVFASLGDSASAQVTNPQNPQNSTTQFQKNEVGANEDSAFGNPLDLIHNMNMRRSRNSSQFAEDTETSLNQAADEFKRLQQQRMENQFSNPVPNPSSGQ